MEMLEKARALREDVANSVTELREAAMERFAQAEELWSEANALEGVQRPISHIDIETRLAVAKQPYPAIPSDVVDGGTTGAVGGDIPAPVAVELAEGEIGRVQSNMQMVAEATKAVVATPVVQTAPDGSAEVVIPPNPNPPPAQVEVQRPQMRNAIIGLLRGGPVREPDIVTQIKALGGQAGDIHAELFAMKAAGLLDSIVMDQVKVFDLTEALREQMAKLGIAPQGT
jgi:hypothetical protein